MSFYTKQALIESFPAYDVYERETTTAIHNGQQVAAVNISSEDRLGLRHPRGFYREYRAGSVVSYALEYNECPIAAYNGAIERGHATHWINACGASIVSHNRPKWNLVKVEIGMLVKFEGRLFTIEKAPNDNLSLRPIQ